ncbi:cytochrome P450 [Panus rudis PR-1116 ss-1]|nr:cytochrome P450 [Panus rudis PR-1116 ss-1]
MPISDKAPWKAYEAMAHKYGDIIHLTMFGQHLYILTSVQAISDLMEKRSSNYSSRPYSTMLHELMGMDWSLAIMPYGEDWKRVRRGFHQYFNMNVAPDYHRVHLEQSHDFLKRLRESPEKFLDHIRHAFASTIMKVTYGIEVHDAHNEYVRIAEGVIEGFNDAGQPGHFLVDIMPFLKHIPEWFPGATFQKKAKYWRNESMKMLNQPFDFTKNAWRNGSAKPSMVTDILERIATDPNRDELEDIARKSAGIAYVGGADTTVSTLSSLFLALAIHPEVQKRAQAELDTVVGPNRLPNFEDRASLPYVEAIIKEALRWQPVTPMAVPHLTSEDDEYRGYHIPKGSIVMANSWAILHDPTEYPEPHSFKPERFLKDGKLNSDVLDPTVSCFGFGRRVCAGRYFALNSLYSIISSVLHTFDILPPVDKEGRPIPLEPRMTCGIVSYPETFNCIIKPRSVSAEALILDSVH